MEKSVTFNYIKFDNFFVYFFVVDFSLISLLFFRIYARGLMPSDSEEYSRPEW